MNLSYDLENERFSYNPMSCGAKTKLKFSQKNSMKFITEIYSDKALPTWREFNKSILFKAKKKPTTTTYQYDVYTKIIIKKNRKNAVYGALQTVITFFIHSSNIN